jgi:hypothetical protein
MSRNHSWEKRGTYIIRVKAKDVYGMMGESRFHLINMPRDKAIHNSLIYRILEQFPLLQILPQRLRI